MKHTLLRIGIFIAAILLTMPLAGCKILQKVPDDINAVETAPVTAEQQNSELNQTITLDARESEAAMITLDQTAEYRGTMGNSIYSGYSDQALSVTRDNGVNRIHLQNGEGTMDYVLDGVIHFDDSAVPEIPADVMKAADKALDAAAG